MYSSVVRMPKRKYGASAGAAAAKKAKMAKAAATKQRSLAAIANARIGGLLGMEKKYIDYEYDGAVVATVASSESDPATALALNAIAQGDGASNRDGRQAVMKSVQVTGMLIREAVATGDVEAQGDQYVRLVLLEDTQTNGAQFNAEDVFVDPTDTDLDPFTFRNLEYAKRFRILKDESFIIPASGSAGDPTAAGTGAAIKKFKWSVPLNRPVNYSGTTAAVASITDYSYHVMAVKAAITGGASDVSLKYVSRVRFVG